MITYGFGREDLGRVRFAISPLFELSGSFDVLRGARADGFEAAHAAWVDAARARLRGLDLTLLDAVQPLGSPYRPDFAIPPPERPRPSLEEELARMRRTPPERVARELGWAYEGRAMPAAARAIVRRPQAALDRLATLMAEYWQRALAPFWDRITAVLEADIAHRARRLSEAGPLGAFEDLHPDVRWRDGTLEVRRAYDAHVELDGRGLLLLPAVFVRAVWAMTDPPWQPTIAYAPQGAALLWAPRAEPGAALGALVGRRRAEILGALELPSSTQELARAQRASPAGISEHLGVLRRAGLVAGRREGRAVRYGRTPAGDALLRAAGG